MIPAWLLRNATKDRFCYESDGVRTYSVPDGALISAPVGAKALPVHIVRADLKNGAQVFEDKGQLKEMSRAFIGWNEYGADSTKFYFETTDWDEQILCRAHQWLKGAALANGTNAIYYRQEWHELAIDQYRFGEHLTGWYISCWATLVLEPK